MVDESDAESYVRERVALCRAAHSAGRLSIAEACLGQAAAQLPDDQSEVGRQLRLNVLLEQSSIAQHRGDFERAEAIAERAQTYALDSFGIGLQTARASARRYFAWEAQRRFGDAYDANMAMAEQLSELEDGSVVRLNCLTRALACAIKNADRLAQKRAIDEADAANFIWSVDDPEMVGWFLFWGGIAMLRRGNIQGADPVLSAANELKAPSWRWTTAYQLAVAHLLLLTPGQENEGRSKYEDASADAEARGYQGLVRSIAQVFGPLLGEA